MWLTAVRLVLARMRAQWFGLVLLGTLVVLAAITILGGYNLRIRSYPVDIELSSSVPPGGTEPRR